MPDLVIAFDTSTPDCPVAVGRWSPDHAELLAVDENNNRANQASAVLVPRIEATLAEAGATRDDVTHVACGRGPGTFTGIRVAVATGMGLALGYGVDLLPLSTLAILAASAGRSGDIRAVLDARRGEVYAASFRVDQASGRVRPLDEEVCAAPEVGCRAPPSQIVVGSGVAESVVRITAAGLWLATRSALTSGDARPPQRVRAVYLRRSYAELGLNRPKRPARRSPFLDP